MRKTKIICTLGPASRSPEMIRKLFEAGMNVGRMNMSHGSHQDHHENIETFRKVRDQLGIPAAVLLDTKGPEIRIGTFKEGPVELAEGSEFTLTTEEVQGDENRVSVSYKNLPRELKSGDKVLINDGMIVLEVKKTTDTDLICSVVHGGTLSDRKGVNIPGVDIKMEYLSAQDKSDLLFGIEEDVDYVAASFMRSADDARAIRNFLDENGGSKIKVIAKIESTQGVDNFEEILPLVNGIMIARGDMGVEVDYVLLPGIQKKFIRRCVEEGKLVITATQMLESMITNPVPTRAEINDVANAVFDGTSAVMLSGESAAGKYPAEAVRTMAEICLQAEADHEKLPRVPVGYAMNADDITNAVSRAAASLAKDVNASVIIAVPTSGRTAARMSKYQPEVPVVGATHDLKVYHQMALFRGVLPMIRENHMVMEELFDHCVARAQEEGYAKKGDRVVLSAGIPVGENRTNTVRVWKINK